MKKIITTTLILCAATVSVVAQTNFENNEDSQFRPLTGNSVSPDSLGSNQEIPKGLKVWTVDERFGDRIEATPDTLQHMYMNSTFSTGLRHEYNTLGNLGSPRINRIFIDRRTSTGDFIFTDPYDHIITPVEDFHFTNTYSPITNVTLNSCGNQTNGEDDFKAMFAVNAGKRLGVGFKFDYKYGRGYYSNQSTAHFNYTLWSSYLGDRYQAHFLFSTLHQKVAENGGIQNDDYIKHPESIGESYQTSEIGTALEKNWNRNDNQHIFLSHRYNIGFNRKVPMTEEEIKAKKFAIESAKENAAKEAKEKARKRAKSEGKDFDEKSFDQAPKYAGRPDDAKIAGDEPAAEAKKDTDGRIAVNGKQAADSLLAATKKEEADTSWMKNEYVPVTSIIHTLKFDNYRRIYQSYYTPQDYYRNEYYNAGELTGDSIFDKTKHWEMKNTFALATLEGFSKWAKAGLKAFLTYDLRHFELPNNVGQLYSLNEHSVFVGGQLSKRQGKILHYNVLGEIGVAGSHAGTLKLDGSLDVNVPFLGDTLSVIGEAFFHRNNPAYYYNTYHARHAWWDNSFDKIMHARIMGTLRFNTTNTTVRVAMDEIKNYAYFTQSYTIESTGMRTGVTVTPMQSSGAINLLTLQWMQDFRYGILNWENVVTYQHSSDNTIIPVPDLNIYTNLYIKFRIAKVLNVDLGADATYFTSYEAPDYSPYLGSFTVQGNGENNVKIGNYPIISAYANVHIKHVRFFLMMSHINAGQGNKNYFFTPHYPLNERLFRFGVSWNFFN